VPPSKLKLVFRLPLKKIQKTFPSLDQAKRGNKKARSRFHVNGLILNPAVPTFALAVLSSAQSA
jgi:hypothetical protein